MERSRLTTSWNFGWGVCSVSETTFNFLPFRDVPDYAATLVYAVGLAAVNWGKMEQQLEMLLRHVNRQEYVTGQMDRFPDTSFRLKSEAFERWYAKHPSFTSVHEIAASMMVGLKKANKSRVRLFHSSVQEFSEGPPPRMIVRMLRPASPDGIRIFDGGWSEREILDFNELLSRLCEDLARVAQLVMNEPFRQSLRTAKSQTDEA